MACAVPTSVASQLVRASAVDAFVPDYRCGAVPDLHRVPSSDAWNTGEPTQCGALYGQRVVSVKATRDLVSTRDLGGWFCARLIGAASGEIGRSRRWVRSQTSLFSTLEPHTVIFGSAHPFCVGGSFLLASPLHLRNPKKRRSTRAVSLRSKDSGRVNPCRAPRGQVACDKRD